MNSTTTNIIVVAILVLLVGFGVWYFTAGRAPVTPSDGPSLEVNLDGGSGGGGGAGGGGAETGPGY